MNKLLTILIAIGSAIVGLFSLFLAGVKRGQSNERAENAQRILDQSNVVKQVRDNVDNTSVDDMRKQLREKYTAG